MEFYHNITIGSFIYLSVFRVNINVNQQFFLVYCVGMRKDFRNIG